MRRLRVIKNTNDWIAEFSLNYFEDKGGSKFFLPSISSSIEIHPHQFKGRALFEHKSNYGALLIADEVGLGKTYSAGHLIYNMVSEGIANRVLVLCPARLVADKWVPTLRQFELRPIECHSGRSLQRWLKGDFNSRVMVSSYEKASKMGVSIDEFEESFAKGKFQDIDLLVIDEIHNFVQNADLRIRLAKIALNLTSARIGLTATPIWKGRNDFKEIIQLLQPEGEFSSDLEKEFEIQGLLFNLYFEIMNSKGSDQKLDTLFSKVVELFPNTFEMKTVSKLSNEEQIQIASKLLQLSPFSSWMLRTTAREVMSSRKRIIINPILVDLDETPGDLRYNPDTDQAESSSRSERVIFDELQKLLKHPAHKLQLASLPSSFSSHLETIPHGLEGIDKKTAEELSNELREKPGSKLKAIGNKVKELAKEDFCKGIVLFTKWVPTYNKVVKHLEQILVTENDVNIKLYKGDPSKDKDELKSVKDRFQAHNTAEIPVIIVTSIFNEGLDLFRANCMIHLDVPTNPLQIEQRIGRIDRMGQTSEEIYIYYILLNQSKEHECLEILKSKLEEFGRDFGVANQILPNDIGWKGKITDDVISLIRTRDISSMASLSLPDEQLTTISDDYADILKNPLKSKYSLIVHNLFNELLEQIGVRVDDTIQYCPEKGEDFVEKFGNNDAILVGQQGDLNHPGLLEEQIDEESGLFVLQLDHNQLPIISEIKNRAIAMVIGDSPDLQPIYITNSNLNHESYIVRVSCTIDGKSYSHVQGYSNSSNGLARTSNNEWMTWLNSADYEESLSLISDVKQKELIPQYSEELESYSNRWLNLQKNNYRSRMIRMKYSVSRLDHNTETQYLRTYLNQKITEFKEKIRNCKIKESRIEILAIVGRKD